MVKDIVVILTISILFFVSILGAAVGIVWLGMKIGGLPVALICFFLVVIFAVSRFYYEEIKG
jgi:hypothetical protein